MDATTLHAVRVEALSPEAFAPYGEVIAPRLRPGQFHPDRYEADDPHLVLTNGEPLLRIMHLRLRGLAFSQMGRHRRVTQCLGALQGKDWFLAVAPPDVNASAPRLEEIVGFHIPGDRIVKLHLATWHAGPHFVHEDCLFINLENRDTNTRDFEVAELPRACRLAV
ncbi:MAG: ureidoglycolate lyase [Variibacter sp.]|nr:ureidoglycolate lyase [Variibacter sp.]